MTYQLLKFAHLLGSALIAAGLIGVFIADLCSRQVTELPLFAEAVRYIAVCYDGLVVPGAILLLASGIWLIAEFHNGWAALREPWIAGMVALFACEFVEGNIITRIYFMRLRRLTRVALGSGAVMISDQIATGPCQEDRFNRRWIQRSRVMKSFGTAVYASPLWFFCRACWRDRRHRHAVSSAYAPMLALDRHLRSVGSGG